MDKFPPFAYLSPFIHQQDLPCCRFLLLVSISLVKMTALVEKIWLVGFLSLFKARSPPKMDYWLIRQSILLLQEVINLLIEHHQRLHLAPNFSAHFSWLSCALHRHVSQDFWIPGKLLCTLHRTIILKVYKRNLLTLYAFPSSRTQTTVWRR